MKYIYALFLLLFIALPISELRASYFMGGEISWECLSNGNYRFTMTVYRECYNTTGGITGGNFPQTLSIQTTVPGHPNISMTRLPGYPIDISPQCNPDTSLPHISCSWVPNVNASMGAMQEHVFTSDSSFPAGVPLSGIPPVTGWVFSYSSCCRKPSTNIPNSSSMMYYLRAIMYPYYNQNISSCFDNSPRFMERPLPAVSSDYPTQLVYGNFDPDQDSLIYSFVAPMNASSTAINTYDSGYSSQNPLPGTLHHPLNVPATLDAKTGLIRFTSYTQGAFITCVKVTAYKYGKKVSETFRDIEVAVRAPSSNNIPPRIISHLAANNLLIDTVSIVAFNSTLFIFADSGLLPNNQRQSLHFELSGEILDTSNYPSPSFIPVSFGSTDTAGLMFSWTPQCKHWKFIPAEYFVHIRVSDDFCPFPGNAFYTLKLVVVNDSLLIAPKVCTIVTQADFMGTNIVNITWNPPADPYGLFHRYELYCTKPGAGIDTIYSNNNILNSSYTHQSQTAQNPLPHTYFLKVSFSGGCGTGEVYGGPETTLNLNYLHLATDSIRLSWNNVPTATSYEIWSIDPNMMLNLEGTTTGTSFDLHLSSFSKQFLVRAIEAGQACHSGSNTIGPIALGLEDAQEDFRLFPNPTSGELILPAQFEGERVMVYDSMGQMVFDAKATARINISHLESGIYFVSLQGRMFKILLIGN